MLCSLASAHCHWGSSLVWLHSDMDWAHFSRRTLQLVDGGKGYRGADVHTVRRPHRSLCHILALWGSLQGKNWRRCWTRSFALGVSKPKSLRPHTAAQLKTTHKAQVNKGQPNSPLLPLHPQFSVCCLSSTGNSARVREALGWFLEMESARNWILKRVSQSLRSSYFWLSTPDFEL